MEYDLYLINILMIFGIKEMDNFDPLKKIKNKAFVLQGHK